MAQSSTVHRDYLITQLWKSLLFSSRVRLRNPWLPDSTLDSLALEIPRRRLPILH